MKHQYSTRVDWQTCEVSEEITFDGHSGCLWVVVSGTSIGSRETPWAYLIDRFFGREFLEQIRGMPPFVHPFDLYMQVDPSFCFAFNRSYITIGWCLLLKSFLRNHHEHIQCIDILYYKLLWCHWCWRISWQMSVDDWIDIGRQLLPPGADVKFNFLAKYHFQRFWFQDKTCYSASYAVWLSVLLPRHTITPTHLHKYCVGSIFETSCWHTYFKPKQKYNMFLACCPHV